MRLRIGYTKNKCFNVMKKGDVKNMPYFMKKNLDEKCAAAVEKGIKRGKRKVAKALIGILQDEVIAEKVGLNLEEVKKLHSISFDK